MTQLSPIERLRQIIHSRDGGDFCVCVPAENAYDNRDHLCAMHADIKEADRLLDALQAERKAAA